MNQKKSLKIVFGNKSSKSDEIIHVREQDFEIPHGEDYKIAIQEFNKIHNMIFRGKPFLEHFLYEDINLWWFIYQSLIGNYKKIINFVKQFSEFLDETNPSVVEVINIEKLDMIKKICAHKQIKCVYSKSSKLQYTIKQRGKKSIKKKRFEKITKEKINARKNLFLKKSKKIPSIENKIVFAIPTIYRRQIFNSLTGITQEGEYIQQSIMDLLNQNIVAIDLDYTFRGNLPILSNRLNESTSWFPIEMILNEDESSIDNRFLENYKKLISSEDFHILFSFDGIQLWDEIEETFNEMSYAPHLPFYLNLISSLSTYLEKNKPKIFFLPYETGPFALAIIAVCKKNNINTIGVQHGYIYEYNPMYSYGSSLDSTKKYGFLLPDHLLLFGDHPKELLLKNGYPSEKLISFGNPAFFGLRNFFKTFNKAKVLKKLTIKKNQKVILFTTGKLQQNYTGHGKYDYDEQIWKYLIDNFGNKDNFFLILKPHPQEKIVDVYENLLQNKNCKNAIITHDSIFDLIYVSDVILSVFSSTMLDGLCFNKPVIRVKFGNEKHHIFDNTEALITTNLERISLHIMNIINDQKFLENLSKKISKFIKHHYGIPEENPKLILEKIIK